MKTYGYCFGIDQETQIIHAENMFEALDVIFHKGLKAPSAIWEELEKTNV